MFETPIFLFFIPSKTFTFQDFMLSPIENQVPHSIFSSISNSQTVVFSIFEVLSHNHEPLNLIVLLISAFLCKVH